MPKTARGYAALSATAPLAPHTLTRRDPRPDDVAMDVLYCGVCHTDIHRVRDEWGGSRYPVVPGHEVIGRVTEVGSAVTDFKPGDIVGVGCLVDSCQHCDPCEKGLEQYCAEGAVFAYNSLDRHDGSVTQGGYSERLLVSDKFVLHIPSKLDLKSAGPLLCAGISTYSPLKHWKVGKGSKVGIVALGGSGHMALKLAKAFGAEVTLFTRVGTQEHSRPGACRGGPSWCLITDPKQMQAVARSFDFILDTVPNDHDINPYIASLACDGAP